MNRDYEITNLRLRKAKEIRLWVTTVLCALFFTCNYYETHPEEKQKLRDKYDTFMNRYRKNPEIVYYPPSNQ